MVYTSNSQLFQNMYFCHTIPHSCVHALVCAHIHSYLAKGADFALAAAPFTASTAQPCHYITGSAIHSPCFLWETVALLSLPAAKIIRILWRNMDGVPFIGWGSRNEGFCRISSRKGTKISCKERQTWKMGAGGEGHIWPSKLEMLRWQGSKSSHFKMSG